MWILMYRYDFFGGGFLQRSQISANVFLLPTTSCFSSDAIFCGDTNLLLCLIPLAKIMTTHLINALYEHDCEEIVSL